ncbi:MAG: hypothetical protein Tp172MES00d2C118482111_21 [Prokaryotic dsDNA virus sp.]|nr:MAG: hypothetical protein Tp172MES00d2C118482111_21 [Prokaryotic dsDNA virus sp.]|tara:strand:- start:1512 stop:1718 length:207 start_codon:yes stop_codon:yes gene_type:complete
MAKTYRVKSAELEINNKIDFSGKATLETDPDHFFSLDMAEHKLTIIGEPSIAYRLLEVLHEITGEELK